MAGGLIALYWMAMDGPSLEERIARVPAWFHRMELAPGVVTPGVSDCSITLSRLELPEDCRGMRVLDVGTRDGFFAFEMERRGAEVVAIDYVLQEQTGFRLAAEALGSRVHYLRENLFHVTRERHGGFDLVLCLGVLNHVRDPLGALDTLRGVCRGELFLETAVSGPGTDPVLRFHPRDSAGGDFTMYWTPNLPCLEALVVEAGFLVGRLTQFGDRAVCRAAISLDETLRYYARIARELP